MAVMERVRQIKEEGWTAEHDDQHVHKELRDAALYYACVGTWPNGMDEKASQALWPWGEQWRKIPRIGEGIDRPRCMVKAIALLMAELDRMLRNEWRGHPMARNQEPEATTTWRQLKDGEPCDHPGCSSHQTHPCERCGRVGAKGIGHVPMH